MPRLTESIATVRIAPNTSGEWIDRELGIIRIQFPIGYSGWSVLQNPENAPTTNANLIGILTLPYPVISIPDEKTRPLGSVRLVETTSRNRYNDPIGSALSTRSAAATSSVDPGYTRSEMVGGWEEGDSRLVVTPSAVTVGGGMPDSAVISVGEDGTAIVAADRTELPSNTNVAQLSNTSDIFREWIPKTIVTAALPNQYPAIAAVVKRIGNILAGMNDLTELTKVARQLNAANDVAGNAIESVIDKLKRLVA